MNYPTCGHAIAPSYWNYKDSHGQPLFILRISVFFFQEGLQLEYVNFSSFIYNQTFKIHGIVQ